MYAPTFRGNSGEHQNFKLPFDYNFLDALPINFRLVIKLHPCVNVQNIKVPNQYSNRVILLNSNEDVNEWMIFSDILITDYSSLIFEYALMDKPIIFYPYDLNDYFEERGFYFNYDSYTYGDVAKTQEELQQAIIQAEDKKVFYSSKKQEFLEKFMSSCDGNSSKRIIDLIHTNKKD